MCTICREAETEVAYVYRDGRVIHVHAACHVLWRTVASARPGQAAEEDEAHTVLALER
jgi:hypothetical protein